PPRRGRLTPMHHPIDSHDLERALERAAGLLRGAERVAVLTGAGVSAESGVPTVRGAGGPWEGPRGQGGATPARLRRGPEMEWGSYTARRAGLRGVRPNPGHHALASLEDRVGSDRFALITQNIDGLHRAAGSRHVLELHGNLARVRCTGCGAAEDRG